jgi:cell division protein FtsB
MPAKYIVEVDSIVGTSIWIDTPEWKEWLSVNTTFRYEGKGTNFNCLKRKNGRWYAGKKVYSSSGCKAIALYIGTDKDCTLAKLQEIAGYYALDWSDFWAWYYSEERKASRKVVQDNGNGTPYTEDLQTELHRLQLALEEMTADRDRQLIRIAELQNRMNSEIQACTVHQRKQLEQLESYNREIDRANGYLEKDNAKLREENQKLKAEVELLRSSAIATGQQNDETIPTHAWSVGSIKTKPELMKGLSRRQFDKMGNFPTLPDGSHWRRIGSKQDMDRSDQHLICYGYPANTVFYVCVG